MRERFCAILVLGAAAGGRQIYDRERNWIAMAAIGFDNLKYLTTQSEQIKKRIAQFGGKLYLEFGGKLFDDYHASRVLPGFEPDSKVRMLQQLKDDVEILIAINAADIEKNKVRGDLGITYDDDVLRLIDSFRSLADYLRYPLLPTLPHRGLPLRRALHCQ